MAGKSNVKRAGESAAHMVKRTGKNGAQERKESALEGWRKHPHTWANILEYVITSGYYFRPYLRKSLIINMATLRGVEPLLPP